MLLTNSILGGIEDQVGVFLLAKYRSYFLPILGAPFGTSFLPPLKTNEPLFAFIYNGLAQLFNNPVLFVNLFSLLSILLTVLFSFAFFRFLKLSRFLSFCLSLVFSFSPYTWLHIGIHPQLSQIWLIPLFLMSFLRIKSWLDAVLAGLVLSMAVLISNYLGFFLILFVVCFQISTAVFSLIQKGKVLYGTFLIVPLFLSFFVFTIPFLYPYLSSSYLNKNNSGVADTVATSTARSIEDFQNFSARPWYFVLPPLGNPWLGKTVTKPILGYLKNNWGYFLADDYFPKEHGGDYFGWVNLTLFFCIVFLLFVTSLRQIFNFQFSIFKDIKISRNLENENFVLERNFIATIFFLFLFTLPPFFTLGGHTVYTPGFLVYKFFPMFRVTARLGVLILLLVLSINGLFLQKVIDKFLISKSELLNKSKIPNSKIFKNILAVCLIVAYLMITLFEFYIPVSRFNAGNVPSVYVYLSGLDGSVSLDFVSSNGKSGHYFGHQIIAEYPSGRSEDVFWMTIHNKGFINPRMYVSNEYGFDAGKFTKELITTNGVNTAKSLGVSYIVFHKNRDVKPSDERFFRSVLTVEKEFENEIIFNLN